MPKAIYHQSIDTPIGPLTLYASEDGLVALYKPDTQVGFESIENRSTTQPYVDMVQRYFAGDDSVSFTFDPHIGTELQRKVWYELQNIPYGETISYTELAKRVGKPSAVRAVASACGRNPIPVLIPCHRVVAKDGSLGGFTWGLPIKKHLLSHEGIAA